jgi:beta-1,4-mannosyltransferase
MIKAAWMPDSLANNRSVSLMKKSMELAGIQNVSSRKQLSKNDYLVLNFYEDIQKKYGFYAVCYLGKLVRLICFRMKGIRIIWFVNNKVPHDDNAFYAVKMMKHLVKMSEKVVVMCTESVDVIRNIDPVEKDWKNKLIYLPHPSYIGAYTEREAISQKQKSTDFNILFFGSIRPYKNVDLLIKTFKSMRYSDIHLTIAGKVKTKEYADYITDLGEDDARITLKLEYVSDEDICSLIAENDIVVLPFDTKTMLNSGSVILTCSCGSTFISPEIGTVKDLPHDGNFYSYTYSSEKEQETELLACMNRAYKDYATDEKAFSEKGDHLKKYIAANNSIECLAEVWKKNLDTVR